MAFEDFDVDQNESSTAPSESTGGSSPEPDLAVPAAPAVEEAAVPPVEVSLNPDFDPGVDGFVTVHVADSDLYPALDLYPGKPVEVAREHAERLKGSPAVVIAS